MELIILEGDSGSGKTFSLRNLDPKRGIIISPNSKPLSFKGGNRFNVKVVPLLNDVAASVKKYIEKGASWVVVEDFTHWITERIMSEDFRLQGTSKAHAFTRYEQFAHDVYKSVFALTSTMLQPCKVVLLSHTMKDDDGQRVFKTAGKMLDEKIIPPSYARIVLHAIVTDEKELDKKYRFLVNARSQYQAKSPYEMFPTDTIENDMAKVFEYIDAFNTANPAKEPKKEAAEQSAETTTA